MKRTHLVGVIWILSGLFVLALVTNALPWLRGDAPWMPDDGKWIWFYVHPRWGWLVASVLGLALYVAGVLHWLRDPHTQAARYPVRLILWAFGGAVLLPLLLMALEGRPIFVLFARSASTVTGGYHYAATLITDLGDTLRHWPDFIADYREITHHRGGITFSPPGLAAAFYAETQALDVVPPLADRLAGLTRPLQCQNLAMTTWSNAEWASLWLQMFMPLWAALAVAPLYRLGTMLFGRDQARLAVGLWPLVPGLAVFQPRVNVFFPLVTLVMLVALWRGLLHDRRRWIAISGFVISVAIFMNLSLVPLGLLGGLTILGYRLLPGTAPRTARARLAAAARDLLVFGAGSASCWLVFWLLSGLDPYTVIDTAMQYHYGHLNRPYLPWLTMHPYDTFLFVGFPLTFFTWWRVYRLRRLRQGRTALTRGDLFSGAAALTLVIMVISGTGRGESGRVWLWLAPLWLLMAADVLRLVPPRELAIFLGLQAACVVAIAGFLDTNFTELTEPARPARASAGPTYSVGARFEQDGDRITFVGLSVAAAPTEVTLHLQWEAETWIAHPYVLALSSVRPDGTPGPDLSWNPAGWDYPPACWTPQRAFVDSVTVSLGDEPAPGDWLFSLSIVDAFSLEPMTVTMPDGTLSTQVGIGPVHVPAG